jgi:hypothetical protein
MTSVPQTQPTRHAGLSVRALVGLSIAALGVIAIGAGFRSGLIATPGPTESASFSQSLDAPPCACTSVPANSPSTRLTARPARWRP